MSLATLGVILSGSRYAFGGMLCFILIFAFGHVVRRSKKLAMAILKTAAAGVVLIALIVTIILQYDKNNRMIEILTSDLTSTDALEDIGTIADRFSIYTAAFDSLEGRSWPKTIFGTGTSSGTAVMLMAHPELADKVDGNRAFHNEFLRAFYEWGVFGLSSVPRVVVFPRTRRLDTRRAAEVTRGLGLSRISSRDFLRLDDREYSREFRIARRNGICARAIAQRGCRERILRVGQRSS